MLFTQVANGADLDYESFSSNTKSVTVSIECYDQGQLSVNGDIDMVILDVNETPTDIVSQSGIFEIEENNVGGKSSIFFFFFQQREAVR